MCGIVGLHLKDDSLNSRLGELLTPMLVAMGSRGPDSAGIALYDDALPTGTMKWSLHAKSPDLDWNRVAVQLGEELGTAPEVRRVGEDAVLMVESDDPDRVRKILSTRCPEVQVFSAGRSVEVFKDVGHPATICATYGISSRAGYQGLGHTRMATESAVTTAHSHPFSAGSDLCLVHNGSFSNYSTIRRRLSDAGVTFDTDNDSEVAARYLDYEIVHGADLEGALQHLMEDLDGFFTLLVANDNQFAVVRDAFACKPAVIAETDGYVAMASEYHALTGLPDIGFANVFEPMPKEIHIWKR